MNKTIMNKTISCTVLNATKADVLIERLRSSNFPNSEVSVLCADNKDNKIILEKHTKAPEGAAAGGSSGAVIGSVLGWLVGIGSLAIPGVGPFIAAGPIMAALGGSAVGAAVGGVLGTLVGLGIPEVQAKQYESKIKAGHVLISVHTDVPERIKLAREIFKDCAADDISEKISLAA